MGELLALLVLLGIVGFALTRVPKILGQHVTVEESHRGLLYSRGKFVRLLDPGRYWLWKPLLRQTTIIEDLRLRSLTLTGQEIVTKDQINIKVSLIAHFKVVDPIAAYHEVESYPTFLHQELQLALRGIIAAMTLDEVLTAKGFITEKLKEAVAPQVSPFGLDLRDASLRDVILPAEIKSILSKALEAEKVAKSSLISAREELAAARCQANTANLIKDNPVILKLKELQTIAEFGKKTGNTIIFASSSDILSALKDASKDSSGG